MYKLIHTRTQFTFIATCFCTLLVFYLAFTDEVRADQRSPQLSVLFESLLHAGSNSAAQEIEHRIWQEWLVAPNEAADATLSQVVLAMQQGSLEIALTLCNQLIDGSPMFAEAWNKRATVHYLLGDHDQSVADIRQTLALEPRHFGAISGLGLIFIRQGNYDAALDAFEQVLEISPASENARQSAQRVRNELGREI